MLTKFEFCNTYIYSQILTVLLPFSAWVTLRSGLLLLERFWSHQPWNDQSRLSLFMRSTATHSTIMTLHLCSSWNKLSLRVAYTVFVCLSHLRLFRTIFMLSSQAGEHLPTTVSPESTRQPICCKNSSSKLLLNWHDFCSLMLYGRV